MPQSFVYICKYIACIYIACVSNKVVFIFMLLKNCSLRATFGRRKWFMLNKEMLTRNRRRQIEMAEERDRNVQAAYEGEAEANQLRGELNRLGVEDVGESDDNGLIIVILEEVKRVVRDLEQERRVGEAMTANMVKQNQELAKRLNSIESEQKLEQLKIVDLEA